MLCLGMHWFLCQALVCACSVVLLYPSVLEASRFYVWRLRTDASSFLFSNFHFAVFETDSCRRGYHGLSG
ncbi:hypothetical protein M758_9G149300 [Ceratodon purpureus]|uniref:Secreted protein n=1 Tax=Ceratodon purpureus TaxID=3225 RepID=A0A8T0GVN3_CERPU|nr:hypothetical protein KC19_9G142400 [Ceratodon purpureus]KAG0606541.1 hypothetical protein M758_9G149300 [Ceratodon purpureus]